MPLSDPEIRKKKFSGKPEKLPTSEQCRLICCKATASTFAGSLPSAGWQSHPAKKP